MRLHDLLAGLAESDGAGRPELRGEPAVEVSSVVHDSREVSAGALFCCIRGSHDDGHRFAPAAVAAGAVALLVEEWVPVDVPQARVPSVRAVLGPLASRFFGSPSQAMRVLGVTGTNGKTTTTYLLEAIANAAGDRTGVIGTVSARVGERTLPSLHTTPEATELQSALAAMRDDDVMTVAMEVSSHALDQHRVDATSFAATCFTNLSHDHLDYHGSLDAYFEAKARLFTPEFTRRAAVHVGDDHGARLAQQAKERGLDVARFAIEDPDVEVTARDVVLMPDGTSFELVACGGEPVALRTGLVGSFNVVNALAAAATAVIAGFDLEAVVAGLERPIVVPGRMERIDAGQDFTVLVDYAHTPDALGNALGAARELAADARVIVVFGCGGDRDRAKRPLMGGIAARLADRSYVTTDNPRSEDPAAIIDEIVAGVPAGGDPAGGDVITVADRGAAIRAAIAGAQTGDVVLVAGKGHETGQTAHGETTPFDDRLIARAELIAPS
ncbi:MAG: UDP-N-acetylmuramoyl-L-alanyl-D-glutamate--2,6-diaminopimelate ligase [Actinomycetota bacterium]|nr:UDP-N-acetylmuramoyl-L-alanyl-D-glutamate--2,6-diaminopimelate ligase [Actinomycetota bacterium]